MLQPQLGQIFLSDLPEKKRIGYLHQDLHLIEHWSIKENLDLVDSDSAVQNKWLKLFGLQMASETIPSYLSGGKKQRVGLIWIILSNANTFLLDEPTVHLDDHQTDVAFKSIKNVFKDKTVLIVSHDQRVQTYSDLILIWQKDLAHGF